MTNCPVCGKGFDDKREYENHVEQSHKTMNDTYSEAFSKEDNEDPRNSIDYPTDEDIERANKRDKILGQDKADEEGVDEPIQSHADWEKELEGLKDEFSGKENYHYRVNEVNWKDVGNKKVLDKGNHYETETGDLIDWSSTDSYEAQQYLKSKANEGSNDDVIKDLMGDPVYSQGRNPDDVWKEYKEKEEKAGWAGLNTRTNFDNWLAGEANEDHPRINISRYKGDGKWEKLDDLKSEEEGADEPLKKVDDLSESWNRINTEDKAKLFESLGINQGSAYTLANLDWYNLSPQLKKDASEAYAKEEDELVIDNDEDLYALHKGLMDKPIKDDKEINEAYRDFYNLEKNHQSPDYKKKAIECSRCNEKFYNNKDRNVHFNEVHATEHEYNLPEECPFCKIEIKEPETLDYHMQQEHGAHIPSQYTQTGIAGSMADTDFDRLEQSWGEAKTEGKYRTLEVGGISQTFDTYEEMIEYYKNFPEGSWQYSKSNESKATEARTEQEILNDIKFYEEEKRRIASDPERFGLNEFSVYDALEEGSKEIRKLHEELDQTRSNESIANEDSMDDLQYKQKFGHDWWDEKARKERLEREGKEGYWKNAEWHEGGSPEDDPEEFEKLDKEQQDQFLKDMFGEAIDEHSPEEMIKREHQLMGEQPKEEEKKIHQQLKKEFGDEEGFWDDPNNFEVDIDKYLETGDIEKKADEISGEYTRECPTCGRLVNVDKMARHIKEEHGEK